MIRIAYIFIISFAVAFLSQTNAADLVTDAGINMVDTEQQDAVKDNECLTLTQDNSPFLFVYWDERVRTTLSEFREHNRQPTRVIVNLLRHSPLALSKMIAPVRTGFLYAEFLPLVAENYIVTLRKFRI